MAYSLKIHRSSCKQRNCFCLGIIWDVITFRCSVLFRCELCEPHILDSIQDTPIQVSSSHLMRGIEMESVNVALMAIQLWSVCCCVYFVNKNTITPEIGMEPKKDPIDKETFAHSHCMKDSIIIARFLCHDHTASTVCYGYDAHQF